MQNNECIRAKWKGKSMDVFSSCYSSVSVDFVCDRYSLEESKCKKSFDFACDCSFMSGTMQQRRTRDDGSRWIVWRSLSFFKLVAKLYCPMLSLSIFLSHFSLLPVPLRQEEHLQTGRTLPECPAHHHVYSFRAVYNCKGMTSSHRNHS